MGVYSGPDLKEDGLVLALDGANFKSFKGEVTTNIVSDAGTMSSWGSYDNGNDGTFTTEFGTTGYKMINRGSWNGIYKGVTLPSAGTYTISAWFRYWGGAADNNGATVYTSGGGISDTVVGLDKSLIGVWQRVSMTRTYSTTGITFYLISYGGTYGGSNSTWDVTMPQIEQKSYVTNFVDGTRGSTVATGGGWADLIGNGNHGELVNGVREDSANGGSLVFDGTNDYVNSNLTLGTDATIEFVAKANWNQNNSGQPIPISINSDNYSSGPQPFFSSNRINWNTGDGASNPFSNSYIPDTNWHIFCISNNFSSGVATLYIDGVLIGTATALNMTTTGSNKLWIGRWHDGGYLVNMNLSSVKIYNRALTASEIQQNFNATRSRFGI